MSLTTTKRFSDNAYKYAGFYGDSGEPRINVEGVVEIAGTSDIDITSSTVGSTCLIGKSSTATGGDFVVAYASATTLTLGDYPAGVSGITSADIEVLRQINASGSVVATYHRDDVIMNVSTNTLTVTGAVFTNTDKFVLFTNIPISFGRRSNSSFFGGSNGGKYIISGKGSISVAHVAAVGSGYTPGTVTLTITQSGASGGTISTTATGGGELPTIGTSVTVVTGGSNYSVEDTLATTGGGGTGGEIHITAITMEEFDFIVVGNNVIFTELQDSDGTDLLSSKNLSGITFAESIILNSGTGKKIRNMLYTGGNVFGFNY